MPAPSSSRIDPVIGHLAELVGGAADDSPGGLLAVLANMTDPRHHRRGPPPVQPAPAPPGPGMPRAMVILETPRPGQRPHVALRLSEPTSKTAVVVVGAHRPAMCEKTQRKKEPSDWTSASGTAHHLKSRPARRLRCRYRIDMQRQAGTIRSPLTLKDRDRAVD